MRRSLFRSESKRSPTIYHCETCRVALVLCRGTASALALSTSNGTCLSSTRRDTALLCFVLSCLVVILANTPMESNGQGWVRMLFSHVCLGLSV